MIRTGVGKAVCALISPSIEFPFRLDGRWTFGTLQ
jgi:hypothetical protein